MKNTIFSSESLIDFVQRNGNLDQDVFMKIVHECILNKIAYDVCDDLKKTSSINEFKQRAKKRPYDGEHKAAKELFVKFDLTSDELDYLSEIVVSFVYKTERDSLDKFRKKLDEVVICNSCGKEIPLEQVEIDHIHPYVYHGHPRDPSEYQTLCHECNQWKKADAWFPLSFYCKTGQFPKYCLQK